MPVIIKVDTRKITCDIDAAWQKGLKMLTSQILESCNQYCKEDTGMLRGSSLIHSDLANGRMIWQTPYAARQYYEIRTAYTDVNPNASWRWVDVARKKHSEEWSRQAQEVMRLYCR